MLSLMLVTTFKIILTINVIIVLNNFYYGWIINEFCNKKFQDRQYFNDYENVIFFVCPEHQKSHDRPWMIL